jgi:hypothetical protein
MGGGGGDGGYEARQANVEAAKAAARRRVNAQFGEGAAQAVDPAAYTRMTDPVVNRIWGMQGSGDASSEGWTETTTPGSPIFDQAGYDAEVALNQGISANKAARESLYGQVRDNAFTAGKRGLDERRRDAQRGLKFELFAKGLNGGSEDVNQNALLDRTYQSGVLDLGGKADMAAASLRSSDEAARLGLLQSIDAGMDAGSALSSAANQLGNNQARASAEAQGTTVGDLFANAGLLHQRSQYAQGKQAGTDWWNTLSPSGVNYRRSGSGGIITRSEG